MDCHLHLAHTALANTGQQAEHANGILTHERGTAQVIMPAAPKSRHSLPVKHLIRGGVATAVLIDFGIAKAESRVTTTKVGMIKGKLNFMAPEQLRSAPLDRRVDVFGMGVGRKTMAAGKQRHEPMLRSIR